MDYSKCDECARHPHFSKIRMNCALGPMGWNCAPARYKYKQRHPNGSNPGVDFLQLLKGDPSIFSNLANQGKNQQDTTNKIGVLEKQIEDLKSLVESLTYKKSGRVKEENHAY